MTLEPFSDVARQGLNALLSLAGGGFLAGAVTLTASLVVGPFGLLIGLPALVVWPLGMIVVGAPVWAVLHASGHRSRTAASIVGAVVGGLAVPAVASLLLMPRWSDAPILAIVGAVLALSGAVGASAVQSLFYGGQRDPRS